MAVALFAPALASPVGLDYGSGSDVTTAGVWAAWFELTAIVASALLLPRFQAIALRPLPGMVTGVLIGLITVVVAVTGTIAILGAES